MSWFNKKKKERTNQKQDYAKLYEQLARDNAKNLVWLLLGSLISADNLTNIETCENSIEMLSNLKEAIDRVPDGLYTSEEISEIKKHCDDGVEICKQDLETFKNNENNIL